MQTRSTFSEKVSTGWGWYKKLSSFIGLLPAPVLTVIVGYLAYAEKVSPLLLVLAMANAFAIGVIISKFVPPGRERLKAVGAIIMLALVPICIQMVQLQQKASNYELRLDGISASRELTRLPDGGIGVRQVQIILSISNGYDFPIFYRLVSHDTRLEGHDSGVYDEPPDPVVRLPAGSWNRVFDHGIKLPNIPVTQPLEGEANFVIEYGRSPKRLDKKLAVTGPITVMFYPNGALFDVLWNWRD